MSEPSIPKKRPTVVRRGVQSKTIDNVAARVLAAETTSQQEYESRHIPLSQINLWETQPRNTKLTLDDIYRGYIELNDDENKKKTTELDSIIGLALSIKELGMLNEPLAYSLPGKRVQLMGGERRMMAAIFGALHTKVDHSRNNTTQYKVEIDQSPNLEALDIERISVKCYSKKPDDLTLEQIGMTDNSQRKEVSVADKLSWLIRFSKRKESLGQVLAWNDLVDTMGLNRSQAFKWLKVVKSSDDIWVGKVIQLVLAEKTSFNKLADIADTPEVDRENLFNSWFGKKSKKQTVSLGASSNIGALKRLILNNVQKESKAQFESINWEKPSEVKKAFAQFLEIWEEQHCE